MKDTFNLSSTESIRPLAIVIYDGDCNFCCYQIDKLRKLDNRHKFDFKSLHDPSLRSEYPDLTLDILIKQIYVIDVNSNYYPGPAAIRYIAWKIPYFWMTLPLLYFPPSYWLIARIYKLIAANRYRLGGKRCDSGHCKVN